LWVLVGLLNPETQSDETANEATGLKLAIDSTKVDPHFLATNLQRKHEIAMREGQIALPAGNEA